MVGVVPFTRHEAVLLLDGLLESISLGTPRLRVVKRVSNDLRKMAMNRGETIDEVYRNVNGISFQMSSMESAYIGRTIRKPATRLFVEIVSLYRENRVEYDKLLKEARSMVERRESSAPQFLTSLEEKVRDALEKECADNSYGTTVTYLCSQIRGAHAADVKQILDQATWARIELGRYHFVEPATQLLPEPIAEPALRQYIDFGHIPQLMFTKPIKMTYFDEEIPSEASWADAYVQLFVVLYDDYSHVIPTGLSFTGAHRADFGDRIVADTMVAPRHIEGTELFLETNLSATDIVRKIKALLDICNVDYENVKIEYECRPKIIAEDGKGQATKVLVEQAEDINSVPQKKTPDVDAFYQFLRNQAQLSTGTCRSYISAIRTSEQIARKYNYPTKRMLNCNYSETISTAQMLLSDPNFIKVNRLQHNTLSAAINKLLQFIEGQTTPSVVERQESCKNPIKPQKTRIDLTPYVKVLEEKFKKGFRLGSLLDIKKFRHCFEDLNGKPASQTDDALETTLKCCGIVHEGKVFPPKAMLSPNVKDRLINYINKTFAEGRSAIYYEALFQEFSEDFLDSYIYNADMLREYLRHVMDNRYILDANQLVKVGGERMSTLEEIRECLKEAGVPLNIEELCKMLPHIPRETITTILSSNLEFVRNSRERREYFHADSLDLSDEELKNIIGLIADNIQSHRYISGTELMGAIQAKYPSMYESYSMYSDIGWRDALKYKIGDRFSFKGNIISTSEDSLSMTDVFGELAASRDQLSVDELVQFSEEIGSGVIYFDPVYENALRVSEDMFVSKKRAAFRVTETDAVLDRFCPGNYIPLAAIQDFASFPDAGFPWTVYLLESYVAFYSERYMLIHRTYGRSCAVGAIAKKTAGFNDFDDLIVDILATSGVDLNKESAVEWLFQKGYLASHSYKNIENILIRAKAQRNRKR